jgi:hypothetical protein
VFLASLTTSDWISLANTIVLSATFIAIGIYTWETILLRRSADRQVQLALDQQRGTVRPVLLIEFDWYADEESDHLPMLRNVGAGPALDVELQPIIISETERIGFERIPVIRSDGAEPLEIRAFAFKDEGFSQNISGATHLSKVLFRAQAREDSGQVNEFSATVIDLTVTFADLLHGVVRRISLTGANVPQAEVRVGTAVVELPRVDIRPGREPMALRSDVGTIDHHFVRKLSLEAKRGCGCRR